MRRSVLALLAVFVVLGVSIFNPSLLLAQGGSMPRGISLPSVPDRALPVGSLSFASDHIFSTLDVRSLGLKAVLIVGPIDGDGGEWTMEEKANMDLAADVLTAQGVAVHKFYTPNNDWGQIKAAADGAQFLLYRGHGVYWNDVPDVGGFELKDRFISPEMIANDLNLDPNAIVMLYGCFTAGGSDTDTVDIGIDEARRRVTQYATPFFQAGAAGYYANWNGGAFAAFLQYLFAGQTLGQAYESYFDFNPATVARFGYPQVPGGVMWLDKDNWQGYWQYNHAFVGEPDKTLGELFGAAKLGGVPETMDFVYSIPEARWLNDAYIVTPQNVASSAPIPWSLALNTSVVGTSATQGVTPDDVFTVWPILTNLDRPAYKTGSFTVASDVTGEAYDVTVSVRVVDRAFTRVFIPMVTLGASRSP